MATLESRKRGHKELFEKYCMDMYLKKTSKITSKTIGKEKAESIKQVLRGEGKHPPSFKFWVKMNKKFKLISYPELQLANVLCLPSKKKVH